VTLKARLDALYSSYNCIDSATDPIQIVRRFEHPADREVVGFCASALAFGRVASVLQSIERLLFVMGPSPAEYVRSFNPRKERAAFKPLVHRWTRAEHLLALVNVLKTMLRSGSIESFFLEGDDGEAVDVAGSLDAFSSRARRIESDAAYFFPCPSSGSGCKRLNLFLRWMVRRDRVDFGLWPHVSASRLVIPLDTHVIRVGRCLGLTERVSPGWAMAADITAALRKLDPSDPVKYDFSLCHIGMSDLCGFNREQGDANCPLSGLCRPARRGRGRAAIGRRRASARPSFRH
jgi:uncharacterized protein (TIGR02757 family)